MLRQRFLITIVLLVALVFLFNLPPFSQSGLSLGLRRGAVLVVYPFQYVFARTVDFIGNTLRDLVSLRSAQKENARLKEEIKNLVLKQEGLEDLLAENKELNQALGFEQRRLYNSNLVPAEVILRAPATFFQSIMINKGARHRVKVDMVAIAPEGLVGRVSEVFDYTSRVQLLLHSRQAVSVKDQRTGEFGVVQGMGSQVLDLKYIVNQAKINLGDLMVTAGVSEVYPAGIPVGRVEKIMRRDFDLFQTVKVRPTVDFSRLKYLFLLQR